MTMKVLLDKVETNEAPNGTSAQSKLEVGPFPRKNALVLVTAHGSSHYQGPVANAGILLTIRDGDSTIVDDSFEGESGNITFNASASHMFVLWDGQKRTVTADVSPNGAGGIARNRNTKVRLHLIATDIT